MNWEETTQEISNEQILEPTPATNKSNANSTEIDAYAVSNTSIMDADSNVSIVPYNVTSNIFSKKIAVKISYTTEANYTGTNHSSR